MTTEQRLDPEKCIPACLSVVEMTRSSTLVFLQTILLFVRVKLVHKKPKDRKWTFYVKNERTYTAVKKKKKKRTPNG